MVHYTVIKSSIIISAIVVLFQYYATNEQPDYTNSTPVQPINIIYDKTIEQENMVSIAKEADASSELSKEESVLANPQPAPTASEAVSTQVLQPSGQTPNLEQSPEVTASQPSVLPPHAVGWLQIPGTVVDYPVMQADDNAYYLDYDSNGNKNLAGAIFADYECVIGSSESKNIVLYGHDMRNKTMFGSLKYYKSKQYFADNPLIYFQMGSNEVEIYEIFSVFVTNGTFLPDRDEKDYRKITFADASVFQEWLEFFAAKSLYDTGVVPIEPQNIITLSTCSNDYYDARLVIMAVKAS